MFIWSHIQSSAGSNETCLSPQFHLLEKAGIINKTKVADCGKKIRWASCLSVTLSHRRVFWCPHAQFVFLCLLDRKNWSQSWTVLHGGILTFHKDPKSAPTGNAVRTSYPCWNTNWVEWSSFVKNLNHTGHRAGSQLLQSDWFWLPVCPSVSQSVERERDYWCWSFS